MTHITAADLVSMFRTIGAAITAEKDHLSALDGAIGDGDHGVTMAMGFGAVNDALAKLDPAATDPTLVLNTAAKSFLNAVGASSGPLYATGLMRAAAAVKGRTWLDRDAAVALVVALAKGMHDRGKAARGDKTMMDAWLPAVEAIETARLDGKALGDCLDDAVAAATAGAEATIGMVASKGRAARLGERAIGHMDPGAASAVIVLDAIRRHLGPDRGRPPG